MVKMLEYSNKWLPTKEDLRDDCTEFILFLRFMISCNSKLILFFVKYISKP